MTWNCCTNCSTSASRFRARKFSRSRCRLPASGISNRSWQSTGGNLKIVISNWNPVIKDCKQCSMRREMPSACSTLRDACRWRIRGMKSCLTLRKASCSRCRQVISGHASRRACGRPVCLNWDASFSWTARATWRKKLPQPETQRLGCFIARQRLYTTWAISSCTGTCPKRLRASR